MALAAPAHAGGIIGKVELIEKKGRKAKDHSGVVVYVDGVQVDTPAGELSMAMKRKAFVPHLAVVPVGAPVAFPNEDPIFHNVFSVSGSNRFDLGLYKKPEAKTQTFEHPGIVRVYCNIHPQMSAIVLVRDNPYYAFASRQGSFKIEDVPAGTYTLKAWHEKAKETAETQVTVPEKGLVSVKLVLDASKHKRVRHKNKHGKDYPRETKY
jgi:plastocyanin